VRERGRKGGKKTPLCRGAKKKKKEKGEEFETQSVEPKLLA